MSKREVPAGADLDAQLSAVASGATLMLEDYQATRTIAGANRTTHGVARAWLNQRAEDGSLGWVRLRVGGGNYVLAANGKGVPHGIYVVPSHHGPRRYESLRLTLDSREKLHAPTQNHDWYCWARADKFEAVKAEFETARKAKAEREKAVREANADVPKPLRQLLRLAGADPGRVYVLTDGDDVTLGLTLSGDEARAVNAVLTGLLPETMHAAVDGFHP